jgi:hypothetical protein
MQNVLKAYHTPVLLHALLIATCIYTQELLVTPYQQKNCSALLTSTAASYNKSTIYYMAGIMAGIKVVLHDILSAMLVSSKPSSYNRYFIGLPTLFLSLSLQTENFL